MFRLKFLIGCLIICSIAIDNGFYYLTDQRNAHIPNGGIIHSSRNEIILNRGYLDEYLVAALKPGHTLRITNTPGGSFKAQQKLRNYDVIIDGHCASACVWLLITSSRACFTTNTQFYFHAWHKTYTILFRSVQMRTFAHIENLDQDMTRTYINLVREPIRSKIAKLVNTSEALPVPYTMFAYVYPEKRC